MPYVDFDRTTEIGGFADADFVIIGAGAAGIFLACTLAARRRKVLLVESGHFAPDDDRQSLNTIEQTAKAQSAPLWNRKRILGGTTTAWGGQSLPFSAIDFEARPGLANPGWPIAHADLAVHYARANAFMGVDTLDYEADIAMRLGHRTLGFDREIVRHHYSKWARQPNFHRLHGGALRRDVTVLYNAQLIRLNLGDAASVRSITLANFRGGRADLPVRCVLLATGGIEANRTLLLNTQRDRVGLGGRSGWLGRGFMDHPTAEVGVLVANDERFIQRHFSTQWRGGRKYSVRLSAGESWLRQHQIPNVSASLMFARRDPGSDWVEQCRRALTRPGRESFAGVWRLRRAVIAGLSALARDRFVYRPGAISTLTTMAEQEGTAASYIALASTVDRFNLPRARLHWEIPVSTWHTTVAFSRALQAEFRRLGLGDVTLHSHTREDDPDWSAHLGDVNHHMGGTRMSACETDGVVDPRLRPWGVENLHVCSASVFPSSSHSNPTLTLLALCSKLADELAPPP